MSDDAAADAVAGSASSAPIRTRADLKEMFAEAEQQLADHERVATHACAVLAKLIAEAPTDAHIFDVVAHAFRVCTACGLPPGVAGVPGKNLILATFAVYKQRYPLPTEGLSEEDLKERKQKAMAEWGDLNDYLQRSVQMLLQRLSDVQEGK